MLLELDMNIGEIKIAVERIPDKRRKSANFKHKLSEVLVLALCSTMSGFQRFSEMEMFSKNREKFFKQFLELKHGTPDEDT